MIEDVTAAEIRKWVGRTTYNQYGLRSSDEKVAQLHRFLFWVHNSGNVPRMRITGAFSDCFACSRIQAGSDEDVVKWYLMWLMNGGKEE
jgi:hypothetical protein